MTNKSPLLTKINELLSIFNGSFNAPARRVVLSHTLKLKTTELSFSNSVTLVEYTDNYFDHNIPDGRFISGTFDLYNDWIIVYQAFNKNIAEYAVKYQDFLGNNTSNKAENRNKNYYNPSRMTWIKPNFLWMMYRANWAQKDQHQTNILAIFMKLSGGGFVDLVKNSNKNKGAVDRVNLQWDPHHLPNGNKIVTKRAIQLGVKGSFNIESFHGNIIKIEDITGFVKEQYDKKMNNEPFLVPLEEVLNVKDIKGDNNLEDADINRIKLGEAFRETNNTQMRKKGKKARKRENITLD